MEPNRRRRVTLVIVLIIAIASFNRIPGNESIRTVQFLSIFSIGAISSLLLREIILSFKKNKE